MSKWHSGPPPFPGWWATSHNEDYEPRPGFCSWRWWNGRRWSAAVWCDEPAELAEILSRAPCHTDYAASMKWSDYWPENARVPRIDPRKS